MKYYISDLHIGHNNVINFDNRPFANTDEMFNTLLSNWNGVVGSKDTVYILGDFIWGKENEWYDIVKQFNGEKVLVRGNHDPRQFSHKTRSQFQSVVDYLETKDEGRKVILCHYPILSFSGDYRNNTYMLYGHVHNTRELAYTLQFRNIIRQKYTGISGEPLGQLLHVGCMEEYMDYTPRTLDEIIEGDSKKYPFCKS